MFKESPEFFEAVKKGMPFYRSRKFGPGTPGSVWSITGQMLPGTGRGQVRKTEKGR
jgi:hypothetical protein